MDRFEIHSHSDMSNFRLVDCINKIPNLIQRAVDIGLRGICLTDHETLAGAPKANKIAKKLLETNPDFKVGLGNEIYLCPSRENQTKFWHFILIAKDEIGYKQLRILSSLAWLNSFSYRGMERVVTLYDDLKREVEKDKGHLIATTACLGGYLSHHAMLLDQMRRKGDEIEASKIYDNIVNFMLYMKDLFGDDFYIECAPGCSREQIVANRQLRKIAKAFDCKIVIGTDAHFLKKEDRFVHKAYLNNKDGEREVDAFYEFSYLQEEDEIIEHFRSSFEDAEEFYKECCRNSMEIWGKVTFYDLHHPQKVAKVPVKNYEKRINRKLDKYKELKDLYNSDNEYNRYWVNECVNKLKDLNLYNDTYLSRLEEEARTKRKVSENIHTNMFMYPVTLQHYIDMFWDCGSLVGAGRGSACSGLNHYLLGVTQLDPVKWNLPWFRYMNEDRTSPGDIDLDLCPSKRPYIIQKIKEERGANFNKDIDNVSRRNLGCTLIATYGTEGTKSAILSACRGYRSEEYPNGIDNDIGQYLSSMVPVERGFSYTINDMIYGNPEKGREPVSLFVKEVKKYDGLLEIIQGIDGLVKQRGSHASGIILFDEDPYEYGVFMKTPSGDVITQYDLHDCEYVGMIKYDLK